MKEPWLKEAISNEEKRTLRYFVSLFHECIDGDFSICFLDPASTANANCFRQRNHKLNTSCYFCLGGGTANTLASHLERSNAPGVRVMHAVYIHHPFQTAQFYTLLEGSKTIWRATAFFMIFRNLLVLLCLFSLLEESQPTPNSYP